MNTSDLTKLALLLGLLLAALTITPQIALAVNPDEILSDPAQEARARALSKGLRCVVCRNQSIDDSNADLARDLRVLLRERIVAGDTDEEAVAYLVDRYGQYILLEPPVQGSTYLLWYGPPVLILLAFLGFAVWWRKSRPEGPVETALSSEDRALLETILSSGEKQQ